MKKILGAIGKTILGMVFLAIAIAVFFAFIGGVIYLIDKLVDVRYLIAYLAAAATVVSLVVGGWLVGNEFVQGWKGRK